MGPDELRRQDNTAEHDHDQTRAWQHEHREPGEQQKHTGEEHGCASQRRWHVTPVAGEALHDRAAAPGAMASRRLMRSSIGGWVENSEAMPLAERGLTM